MIHSQPVLCPVLAPLRAMLGEPWVPMTAPRADVSHVPACASSILDTGPALLQDRAALLVEWGLAAWLTSPRHDVGTLRQDGIQEALCQLGWKGACGHNYLLTALSHVAVSTDLRVPTFPLPSGSRCSQHLLEGLKFSAEDFLLEFSGPKLVHREWV